MLLLGALLLAVVIGWVLLSPLILPPAPQPSAGGDAPLAGLRVNASVEDVSLAAAGASADFGVEEEMRRINMRVVEELAITVTLESQRDLVLADPPRLCLVGPFWNPLDAGLSDRCWGDPDLGDVVASQLPTNGDGKPVLSANRPLTVNATIRRGNERCDYAPGQWHLEVGLGPIDLPDVLMYVPYENPIVGGFAGTLRLLPTDQTRLCSYPAAVYLRQGDPPVSSPSPTASSPGTPRPTSQRCAVTPGAIPDATMTISGFQFGDEISIDPGAAVTFTNEDSVVHTVTEGLGVAAPDACVDERIAAGATVMVTFMEVGDYPITCTLHAAMQTVVHVR